MPKMPWEDQMVDNSPGTPEEQLLLLSGGYDRNRPLVGAFAHPAPDAAIGEKEIAKAQELLQRYKDGKANLENRIVEDELWWELRHWEAIGKKGRAKEIVSSSPKPTSAWLFDALKNKHADAMDNYPEPVVLPREASDEGSAKTLSSVLPVVLEYNEYESTYSEAWWDKLKHGTACYGVFWDATKENGLGDISIKAIDLLKLFWEPGITDIQRSRNLFITELVDTDLLEQQYPEHAGKLSAQTVDIKQYLYDDTVDTQDKSVVVDWYYKVQSASGKTILHYAKFVGNVLLFASENEAEYQERGYYDHGMYPVVLDTLYPEKGTPVGFGYISICKDPQLYIDQLSGNILETSMMGTKKRFFVSASTAINEKELLDWNKPIVHVEGELDEKRLQELTVQAPDGIYFNVLQSKIEEMKDTASNRDVNSGGSGAGITAAAAIAALQEAGNKASRDMISASYRATSKIYGMCIELIRQFYDETRSFRITGQMPGSYEFIELNNRNLQDQPIGMDSNGAELYRRPIFDLKIKSQKRNPFSRMEQNERAKELYSMGFFNPERAQEALGALEMMDFEGIDKVKEQAREGQTLLNMVQQMSAQMEQMAQLLQMSTGVGMPAHGGAPAAGPAPQGGGKGVDAKVADASKANMTSYGQNLAKRSSPSMDQSSAAAMPK